MQKNSDSVSFESLLSSSTHSSDSFSEKERQKRVYIKFSPDHLIRLNELYEKHTYPSKKEMKRLSLNISEPLKKLENWFKHKRRTEMKNGTLKYSKKKIFSNDDKKYLMIKFQECKNPNYSNYKLMSKELNCPIKHLKNWFSYKRKVFLKKPVNDVVDMKDFSTNIIQETVINQEILQKKEEIPSIDEKIEITLKKEELLEKNKPIIKNETNINPSLNNNSYFQQVLNDYSKLYFQNMLFAASLNQNFLKTSNLALQFHLSHQLNFPNNYSQKLHF